MRTSILAVLLMLAGLTGANRAAAQTPPPPPPAAEPPAPPPPAPPPPAAAAPPAAPAAAPPAAAAPAAPGAPAAPAAPANWWDKFSGDAFVDAYGAVNWNFPKPQGGTTQLHAYDVAQGFALSWIGLNGAYAADPIGGTISLRFGPSAVAYGLAGSLGGTPGLASADNAIGMQNVRQAYATLKPIDKLTVDFGKFDQPFGSEVPDAQLNMEYSRSLLFTYNQPVFFTGLRVDYAFSDALDAKFILANGWNNTFDDNRSKSIGGQIMIKPADPIVIYVGYMGMPEAPDFSTMAPAGSVPGANDHWRHLVDLVLDINPIKPLRFLVNGDYDTEEGVSANGKHAAIWYGANLAIRYQVTDPFAVTLRGEYFHDEHGDIVPPFSDTTSTVAPPSSNVESGTLTLSYVIASHLSLMLDNRIDVADSSIFQTDVHANNAKSQFTTTLGVIAATK
jgi:putative OmpL-like beta-barrel porin-2